MSPTQSNLKRKQKQLADKKHLSKDQHGYYRVWWDYSSYYSNKLRPFLNYKDIPHKLMQTTLDDLNGEITDRVGVPIMPVVLTSDERVMVDTTTIMEWMEQQHSTTPTIPGSPCLAWIMWLLEDFADEYMHRFSMHFRWSPDIASSTLKHRIARGLAYGHDNDILDLVADIIRKRQSGFNSALGLNNYKDRKNLEQQFDDVLRLLENHFKEHSYLLGERPSIADFAFFGGFWAHLFNDPHSAMLLETKAPMTCDWIQEINNLGDTRGNIGRTDFGDWIDISNGLPKTLTALISFIGKTYIPQSIGHQQALRSGEEYFTTNIYGHPTTLFAMTFRAGTFAQLQQRFADLDSQHQKTIERLLAETGVLPEMMAQGIHLPKEFEQLTPPFVTDASRKVADKVFKKNAPKGELETLVKKVVPLPTVQRHGLSFLFFLVRAKTFFLRSEARKG